MMMVWVSVSSPLIEEKLIMNYKAYHNSGEKQIVTVFAMNSCRNWRLHHHCSFHCNQLNCWSVPNLHPNPHQTSTHPCTFAASCSSFFSLSLFKPPVSLCPPLHTHLFASLFCTSVSFLVNCFLSFPLLLPPLLLAFFPPSLLPLLFFASPLSLTHLRSSLFAH